MRQIFLCVFLLAAAAACPGGAHAQCLVDRFIGEQTLAGDQLGDAIAISGTIGVVGASRHDFLGSASGAAFVFRYGPDTSGRRLWRQEGRLLADDGRSNDLFGAAVALDAMAGSGETIVVGAYFDDNARGSDAGSAYVFESVPVGEGREWILVQTLPVPGGAAGDQYGESVAIRGDLLAVGAPRYDGTVVNGGAVYVYRHDGAQWAYEATLEIADAADNDLFGVAVAVDGDTVLVGAAYRDHAGVNSGAAYLFRHDGATWDEGEMIVPDDGAAQDRFGDAVALRGDLALVGAPLEDDGGANSGSVYAFRFDGIWSQTAKLIAADFAADARFGTSVALTDAVQDDLALVGAPSAGAGGVAGGAAYLYTFDGVDWIETAKLTAAVPAVNDQFGASVGLGDELLLIGAPLDDDETAGVNAGAVHAFTTGLEPFIDCNGNGESDACDLAGGFSFDCNTNGIPDECDIDDGTSDDVNGNGVPDECDDCNENGVPDFDEIAGDPDLDCNENGVIDTCEVPVESGGTCTLNCDPDCNMNGRPDACDIDEGTAEDCNGNGVPDACDLDAGTAEDCDTNGLPDSCDIAAGTAEDCNGNGVPDACDIADGTSQDVDEDGVPDECFSDCNGNGTSDTTDITNGTSEDCNANGIPDECDLDPTDPDGNGETSLDLNDDGVPDECQDCNDNRIPDFFEIASDPDLDCNENGIIDACEIPVDNGEPGEFFCTEGCDPDCNVNGVPDACDIADGTVEDCDVNGVPDQCDPDCNANGIPDACDIAMGTSEDVNMNGVPDDCEDCNDNGVVDSADITSGTSADCNANSVPDECEIPTERGDEFFCTENCDPDCNDNGIPDECDAAEPNQDLNDNGIPDECELDCNENGLPDFLEILWGLVDDENGNGVPDECQCPGDANLDGDVSFADVLELVVAFGPCDLPCPGDFDGNGEVDFGDVLMTLVSWGACP